MLSPAEATLRARIGAYTLHAQRDPRETTAKARSAFLARFEREVDPDGVLTPEERQRRALSARKAHFAKLALVSARKRSARVSKKPLRENAAPATNLRAAFDVSVDEEQVDALAE